MTLKSRRNTRENIKTRRKFFPFFEKIREKQTYFEKWKEFHGENLLNLQNGGTAIRVPYVRPDSDTIEFSMNFVNLLEFNVFKESTSYKGMTTVRAELSYEKYYMMDLIIPFEIIKEYLSIIGSRATNEKWSYNPSQEMMDNVKNHKPTPIKTWFESMKSFFGSENQPYYGIKKQQQQ